MSVTPDFVGQRYKDTNTGNIWIANSTTPGDWTLEVQNYQTLWEPRSLKLGELAAVQGNLHVVNLVGVTSITFLQTLLDQGCDIERAEELLSVTFPNLTTVSVDAYILLFYHHALTNVSMPVFQSGNIWLDDCTALVSMALPSLVTAPTLMVVNCTALTTISVPVLVPDNGCVIDLSGNALTSSSVNALLARGVANPAFTSGTVKLTGGTNNAPSGQGILDKATLIGRGVTVTTA